MSQELGERRDPHALAVATGLVLFSACCFGTIAIFTAVATRAGTPLLSVLTGRYTLAAPMLLAASGGLQNLRISRGRALRLLLFGGGAQACLATMSLSALDYIPVAVLVFLFYTYPALIALWAMATGAERIDARKGGALALSLAGVATMIGAPGSASLHPLGVGLALGSAVLYSVYIPMLNRLQTGISAEVASTYVVGGVAVLIAIIAVITGNLVLPRSPVAIVSIIGLAFFSTTLAFISFLRGLRVLGPVRTSILSTVEPFWTAILGALILSQPLTPATVAGGTLIAAAVIVLQWRATSG